MSGPRDLCVGQRVSKSLHVSTKAFLSGELPLFQLENEVGVTCQWDELRMRRRLPGAALPCGDGGGAADARVADVCASPDEGVRIVGVGARATSKREGSGRGLLRAVHGPIMRRMRAAGHWAERSGGVCDLAEQGKRQVERDAWFSVTQPVEVSSLDGTGQLGLRRPQARATSPLGLRPASRTEANPDG